MYTVLLAVYDDGDGDNTNVARTEHASMTSALRTFGRIIDNARQRGVDDILTFVNANDAQAYWRVDNDVDHHRVVVGVYRS